MIRCIICTKTQITGRNGACNLVSTTYAVTANVNNLLYIIKAMKIPFPKMLFGDRQVLRAIYRMYCIWTLARASDIRWNDMVTVSSNFEVILDIGTI